MTKEEFKDLLEDIYERLSLPGLALSLILLGAGGAWAFSKYLSLATSGAPEENTCKWLSVGDMDACDEIATKGDGVFDQRFLTEDQ